jgi:S1-C subfamily serine protease
LPEPVGPPERGDLTGTPLPWVPPEPGSGPAGWGPDHSDQYGFDFHDESLSPGAGSARRRWRGLLAGLIIAGLALGAGSLAATLGRTPATIHQGRSEQRFSNPSGASPASSSDALARVAAADLPEIVTVVAIGRQSDELGTGWPVDSQGDFITNDHVVHQGISFYAVSQSGTEYPARVVNVDPALDLAEIRVIGLSETPFAIDAAPAALGQAVVVLASEGATSHPPVTDSVIDGLDERATVEHAAPGELSDYSDLIRIPAQIFPGNSGGPMLTTGGQVVGILTLAAEHGSGAFAIPLAEVAPVIERWLAG